MKVKVYYNLHKKIFSITCNGIVLGYAQRLILTDVDFKVNEKGRQRVIKERKKNVHAHAVGEIRAIVVNDDKSDFCLKSDCKDKLQQIALTTFLRHEDEVDTSVFKRSVIYNPYRYSTFVFKDCETPVFYSPLVVLDNKQIKSI